MSTQLRNRPTECLRFLEKSVELEAVQGCRFGSGGEFSVRVASSLDDRLAAWALAYRVYREKRYARPNAQGLWYSIHDALPETVTVLVERQFRVSSSEFRVQGEPRTPNPQSRTQRELIGAVTVVPDSPLGLPADKVFPEETRRLRSSGARLAEAVSLVQGDLSERAGVLVAAKLCEFTCLVAERLLGATDLVITVNPRHEDYYHRVMLFDRRGGEAPCNKVSGAPAVFLTLNFAEMERHIEHADLPGAPKTIYRRFMKSGEAESVAAHMRRQMRSLDAAAFQRYFMDERILLAEAVPDGRTHLQRKYLICELG